MCYFPQLQKKILKLLDTHLQYRHHYRDKIIKKKYYSLINTNQNIKKALDDFK